MANTAQAPGKKYLVEVEILKALAIILVVISHFHLYVFGNKQYLEFLDPYAAYFGLAIFFFLSGYTLYINNNRYDTIGDVINFYKKRLFRIFPLYWVALLVFLILYDVSAGFRSFYLEPASYYDFSITGFIVHFFGLQALTGKFIGGMWFIGTIVVYYLVYPVIVYFSKNLRVLLAAAAVLLVIFVLLYTPLHIIKDGHVPLFISVFAGGIIANKVNLFTNKAYEKYFLTLPIVFAVALAADIMLFDSGSFVLSETFSIVKYGCYFFVRNVLLLTVSILSILCIRPFVGYMDQRARDFFSRLSYGSYATYLFHMQLFPVLVMAVYYVFKDALISDLFLIVFGLPLSLALGYYLQKYYDKIIKNAGSNKHPKRAVNQ